MSYRPDGHQKLVCKIIPTHNSVVAQIAQKVKIVGEFWADLSKNGSKTTQKTVLKNDIPHYQKL